MKLLFLSLIFLYASTAYCQNFPLFETFGLDIGQSADSAKVTFKKFGTKIGTYGPRTKDGKLLEMKGIFSTELPEILGETPTRLAAYFNADTLFAISVTYPYTKKGLEVTERIRQYYQPRDDGGLRLWDFENVSCKCELVEEDGGSVIKYSFYTTSNK